MEEKQTVEMATLPKGPYMTFATEGQRCGFVFEDTEGKCTTIECTKSQAVRFLGQMAVKIAEMGD